MNAQQTLIVSHNSWDSEHDARITMISKCIHLTNCTWLGLLYIRRHLIHGEWWSEVHDDKGNVIPQIGAQEYVNEFDTFVKIGFIQMLISAIESSLRLIVRAIDPLACANGTAEFKSLYSFILARLNLQKWETLFDLIRYARNIIHNNGVFFPRSNKNETITYKGISYSFIVGNKVDFLYWEFLIDLLSDIEHAIVEIVNYSEVVGISSIIDPSSYR